MTKGMLKKEALMTAKQPEPGKKEEDEFSVFSHMERFDGHVPSKVLHKGDIDKTPFEPSLPTIRHDFPAYLQ